MRESDFLLILFFLLTIPMLSMSVVKAKTSAVLGQEYQLRDHMPIAFVGNEGFTSYNGVINPTANGTQQDPFIIEQWKISYSGTEQYSIYVGYTDACFVIRNVLIENGKCGICLFHVTNARIENVTIENCTDGIQLLYLSKSTVISSQFANNSEHGLYATFSERNIITHNIIIQNTDGFEITDSTNNTIFDNLFQNFNSNAIDFGTNNWNTSLRAGKNVIGGTYLGGNYFHNYTGEDVDGDGIGDMPYAIRYGQNKDRLPLFNQPPKAGFTYTPSIASVVDVVQFSDYSSDPENGITSWLWHFGDGANSTSENPTHKYTSSGDYPLSLEVTDSLGKSNTCNATIKVYPAQVLFSLYISKVDIQPQVRKLKASFSMSWISEPTRAIWLTIKDDIEDASFLLSEQTDTLIPIEVGGEFPNDFCKAHFHISIPTNYTIRFSPILSEPLQTEYESMPWTFNSTIESPSAKLSLIPHLYHYDVEIELVRPNWFKTRWNFLTWFPIAIILTLIVISNVFFSPKNQLREYITVYVSTAFFSFGFVSSVLQFLPPTFLLVELLLPTVVIVATLMLAVNMWANMRGINVPILRLARRYLSFLSQ